MNVSARLLVPIIREVLDRGERVRPTATGSSMWPFIRPGDEVELEPPRPPRPGDVVLLDAGGGRYVLHRVVRVGPAGCFVRGDAQVAAEGPFAASSLVARVVTVYRGGRPRRLDAGPWRLVGLAWVWVSPAGLPLLRLARRLRRTLNRRA